MSVQAKLEIGAPNDGYEREADATADRVMRMSNVVGSSAPLRFSPLPGGLGDRATSITAKPMGEGGRAESEGESPDDETDAKADTECMACGSADGSTDDGSKRAALGITSVGRVQRACSACGAEPEERLQREVDDEHDGRLQQQHDDDLDGDGRLQRVCAECDVELEQTLQRDSAVISTPAPDATFTPRLHALRLHGGAPLSVDTRKFMESRFGYSFKDIRIHTDERAGLLARSIGAKAFTLARDVVFGPGQYQPHTHSGRRLLAHELTHTLQQGAVRDRGTRPRIQRSPLDGVDDTETDEPHGRVDKIVIICNRGGKGRGRKGTIDFHVDGRIHRYGLEQCIAPTGRYPEAKVQEDVATRKLEGKHLVDDLSDFFIDLGEPEGVTHESSDAVPADSSPTAQASDDDLEPATTGKKPSKEEPAPIETFSFRFAKTKSDEPDPRTFFHDDSGEFRETTVLVDVNPYRSQVRDLIGDETMERAGWRISHIYDDRELSFLLRELEYQFEWAEGKQKVRIDRLIRRVREQRGIAEATAMRAKVGDELGLSATLSERIEDHPELASQLERLHEGIKELLREEESNKTVERLREIMTGTADRDALDAIKEAKKRYRQAVGRAERDDDYDAANQALMLARGIELLQAYDHIPSYPRNEDAQQAWESWQDARRDLFGEASWLQDSPFIRLGGKRAEVREGRERSEAKVAKAHEILERASTSQSSLSNAGAGALADVTASELLSHDISLSEIAKALEWLRDDPETRAQYDRVMAEGLLVNALLHRAAYLGRGEQAKGAGLAELDSSGQDFVAGFATKALELETASPLGIRFSTDTWTELETGEAFFEGLLWGFSDGFVQIVKLVQTLADETKRAKLVEHIEQMFKDRKVRRAAGAAMAEAMYTEVGEFNASDPAGQAKTMGKLVGGLVFEIFGAVVSAGALKVITMTAKFARLKALAAFGQLLAKSTIAKAFAEKLVDLGKQAAKATARVTDALEDVTDLLPRLTSDGKLTRTTRQLDRVERTERRVVDAAIEVEEALEEVKRLADPHAPDPDPTEWFRATQRLDKAEAKLKHEIDVYGKRRVSATNSIARASSKRPGLPTRDELAAELKLLYREAALDPNAKEITLFDDAVHSYKRESSVGSCFVRHSIKKVGDKTGLCPPEKGNVDKQAEADAEKAIPEAAEGEAQSGAPDTATGRSDEQIDQAFPAAVGTEFTPPSKAKQIAESIAGGGPVKSNLGSGTSGRAGFTNIDITPHPKVDVVADMRNLPFPDDFFDEHFATGFLHQLISNEKVMIELFRTLKPGGTITLFTRNGSFAGMESAYRAAGFVDVTITGGGKIFKARKP
ncbi:eCIS core domain-containing protein [Paraliomyxa miuraensis]|uniref:eCIS core domain-containing protein n=1 Tax=Paraliomyxa miuraensis TaxID=376150 RepID=UPI0022550652|nr:DUF4157 domain-containing protein [Paraliomyxa miuraensis]MCX4240361.1 DUF4157 domain-containing protein [Paraliomyxa miuraensis]